MDFGSESDYGSQVTCSPDYQGAGGTLTRRGQLPGSGRGVTGGAQSRTGSADGRLGQNGLANGGGSLTSHVVPWSSTVSHNRLPGGYPPDPDLDSDNVRL